VIDKAAKVDSMKNITAATVRSIDAVRIDRSSTISGTGCHDTRYGRFLAVSRRFLKTCKEAIQPTISDSSRCFLS
jgi:hypothetical protein